MDVHSIGPTLRQAKSCSPGIGNRTHTFPHIHKRPVEEKVQHMPFLRRLVKLIEADLEENIEEVIASFTQCDSPLNLAYCQRLTSAGEHSRSYSWRETAVKARGGVLIVNSTGAYMGYFEGFVPRFQSFTCFRQPSYTHPKATFGFNQIYARFSHIVDAAAINILRRQPTK